MALWSLCLIFEYLQGEGVSASLFAAGSITGLPARPKSRSREGRVQLAQAMPSHSAVCAHLPVGLGSLSSSASEVASATGTAGRVEARVMRMFIWPPREGQAQLRGEGQPTTGWGG